MCPRVRVLLLLYKNKRSLPRERGKLFKDLFSNAGNLARTQTAGADADRLMSTVLRNDSDLSYIRLPGSARLAVRVGNVMSEGNALSAEFTFCHTLHLLNRNLSKFKIH